MRQSLFVNRTQVVSTLVWMGLGLALVLSITLARTSQAQPPFPGEATLGSETTIAAIPAAGAPGSVMMETVSDWGDAPDPTYPTVVTSTGASHVLGSDVYLGTCVDAESDGQPTADADGDGLNASLPVFGGCTRDDDEDGVAFATPLYISQTALINVTANAACTLSAWLDFNDDGDWSDAGEELFPGGQTLASGLNGLSFVVPSWAVAGATYARFRCTTDGPVSFTGQASDGEVEDYRVQVTVGTVFDFGDAPDPTYPTVVTSTGASHVLGSDVYLGACVDAESDGQPTAAASGDDANANLPIFGACVEGDDEDGVTFTTALLAGETAGVDVTASTACTLSAWIDFSGDGDWSEANEDLFPGGQALAAGLNSLSFAVPTGAVTGTTYARFRCTTDGPVSFTGQASDGEVEDYQVMVGAVFDLGDAPDPTYPTVLTSTGASHVLGSDVYLGACVDAESDGRPTAAANGDDADAGTSVFGACSDDDDEDGVTFTTALFAGDTANIDVTASTACTLSAWIDFSGDGDWSDADDNLFPGGQALGPGVNSLSISVPGTAVTGTTYARFRCTTDGPVSFTGQASDGEVEDYQVQVTVRPPVDFGDAPDPTYPTVLANAGASHVLGSGVYLGACVDAESDGQPTAAADGDDASASTSVFGTCSDDDDEDGVAFTTPLYISQTASISVTASAVCTLSAWIDFNDDGDWSEEDDKLFPGGRTLGAGANSLSYWVPGDAVAGATYARFRCTTDGPVSFTGQASDGEVEDYQVTVGFLYNRTYLPLVLKGFAHALD